MKTMKENVMKKIALIAALLISSITAVAAAPGTPAAPGYPQDHTWNMDDQQNIGNGS